MSHTKLSVGIIGLPNVGKSTLFQALTKKQVAISNYPFTTIEPNVAVVPVSDNRLDELHKISGAKDTIPATIEFVDIAGLVKNAHQGEGLGNEFLSHIREVDAIVHVVRIFEDKNVSHVHPSIDPKNDIQVINEELQKADEQLKEKWLKKKDDMPELSELATKPVIYLFNISENQINKKDIDLEKIIPQRQLFIIMPAQLELTLSEMSEEEKKELDVKSFLDESIKMSYKLLNLITFFTIKGKEQTRAWALPKSSTIIEAAGKIHTDFAQNFIKAEVINWKELIRAGSWQKARELGKIKLAGKDYIVEEGDVIEIKV